MKPTLADAEFRAHLRRGADLWNAHRWFDCHDEWESLWKSVKHERKREPARDPRRDLVHGLILLAVAYHHWTRANLIGVKRKLHDARKLLARYPERVEGVHLAPFLLQVYEDLQRGIDGEPYRSDRVPALVIEEAAEGTR